MIFAPFFLLYFALLFAFAFFFVGMVQVGLVTLAFQRVGLTPHEAFAILVLSLVGSFLNIPVWRLESGESHAVEPVNYFGVRYRMPARRSAGTTVIAVNFGGAVLPTLLSLELLAREPATLVPGALAIVAVSLVTYRFARPLRGVGIAMPMFIAPVAAALSAYVISKLITGDYDEGAVAYMGGAMGTLIGADLCKLRKIKQLGAPVASIGGAGTFDGIFLSGLIAALLV